MSFKPGDVVYGFGHTYAAATGESVDADSTPTAAFTKNGTDDGAVTVTITNVATGKYKLSATIPGTYAAGDQISFSFTATVGSKTARSQVRPETVLDKTRFADWDGILGALQVRSNTATAGGSTSITLDASASATDSIYVGMRVFCKVQVRTITAYVGSTKVATVDRAWQTNPSNGDAFVLIGDDNAKLDSSLQVTSASVQGNVTGSVGSVTGAVGSVTGNVGGNVVGTVAGVTPPSGSDYTTARAAKLDNLDATVSSRLATSGYTAPDNTTISTISTNVSTALSRIGSFTGTGVNTILGFLKALASKTASTPSDIGGTFDPSTDAVEALQEQGAAVKAKTDNLPASPAAVGSQMDLVNAPNATAITAIQSGLGTSANQTTILSRIGSFTGTGVNTILGFLKAIMSKSASTPSDIGGTFSAATDSLEAIEEELAASGGGSSSDLPPQAGTQI